MNINRKEEHERPRPRDGVTVKECGNLIEVRYSVNAPPETVIQKLTAELYLDKRTGEGKAFRHTENRAEDKSSVAHSLCRLRDLINTNVTDPDRVIWVTLTYRENMRDPSRLYEDFRRYRQLRSGEQLCFRAFQRGYQRFRPEVWPGPVHQPERF